MACFHLRFAAFHSAEACTKSTPTQKPALQMQYAVTHHTTFAYSISAQCMMGDSAIRFVFQSTSWALYSTSHTHTISLVYPERTCLCISQHVPDASLSIYIYIAISRSNINFPPEQRNTGHSSASLQMRPDAV